MKLHSFCGAAGGTGQSALFVAGFCEEKAIILDPHYAQEENEEKLQYFKKTPRGIPLNKMASSFSFCFYFDKI